MRTVIIAIMFLLFFTLLLPVLAVIYLIRKIDEDKASKAAFVIVRRFIKMVLFVSGTKIEAVGTENIPDESALYVGNHRSYYDILTTYTFFKRPTGYVAKIEIKKAPIMNLWMAVMNCVFLDRSDLKAGLKAILEAIKNIKKGYSMVIFPEGTRNKSEDKDVPGEFKEGSLKIAEKSGCMVVPVAIKNTEKCFESQFPKIRPNKVRVSFLKPFYISDIPEEYKRKPSAYVRTLIAKELERPL